MTNIYDIIVREKISEVYCVCTGKMEPIRLDVNDSKEKYVIELVNQCFSFDKYGRYVFEDEAECLLFPSKHERNWDRFAPKSKYNLGDIRCDQYGDVWINQGHIGYNGGVIANFTVTPAHEDVVHKKS